MVFDAILTGTRQSGQKLQCLYENPIAEITSSKLNFTQFLKRNVKIQGRRLYSLSLKDVALPEVAQ